MKVVVQLTLDEGVEDGVEDGAVNNKKSIGFIVFWLDRRI